MRKTLIAALAFVAALSGNLHAQTLAFPGAEGFGRFAKGARASAAPELYRVTNLRDSGPGSLRDAVSKPGRIVIFDVSGVIELKSKLVVSSNIYIAGQSAPGEGILVYGKPTTCSGAQDVIMRHMRFRLGVPNAQIDALGAANGHNLIFDHISTSWATDENFSFYSDGKNGGLTNITVQNSLIGQGIGHACGSLIRTQGGISIIRTMYIDNNSRNPKFQGRNQYINSVVYNWGNGSCVNLDTSSESFGDYQNNYFIYGPNSSGGPFGGAKSTYQIYHSGNMFDNTRDGILNGRLVEDSDFGGSPTFVRSHSEYKNLPEEYPVISSMVSAEEAVQIVSENAGATLPVRDMVDDFMIDELLSFGIKGSWITSQGDLGLPNIYGYIFTGDPYLDTDGDGIPDFWEEENGLDKTDPSDAMKYAEDGSGYLNIENYLNSITGPAPYIKYPTRCQVETMEYNQDENNYTAKIQWENNEIDADAVIVEVTANDSKFEKEPLYKETLSSDATKYEFTAEPGNSYFVRWKTVKGEMESHYSSVVTVHVLCYQCAPFEPLDPTPVDEDIVREFKWMDFSWDCASTDAYYNVYLGTSADKMELVGKGVQSKKITRVPVEEHTTYYWQVEAYNEHGTRLSNIWSFTTGERPQNDSLAYYSFDQTETEFLINQFGSDAYPKSTSPVWVEGIEGNALSFTGSPTNSGYVQEHYEALDELADESFSIGLWFKSAGGSGVDWYLLHKGSHAKNSSAGTTGKWLGIQYNTTGKNDRLTFGVDDDITKSDLNISPGSAYFNNEWVYMVCVRDRENQELRVYLNGELAGSMDDETEETIDAGEDFVIGNCNINFNTAFTGLIDELVIYRGVLDEEEIKSNYYDWIGPADKLESSNLGETTQQVYPVPFTDEFTVVMDSEYTGMVKVELMDTKGQIIVNEIVEMNNGTVQVTGLSELPQGYYVCIVKGIDKNFVVKVVK